MLNGATWSASDTVGTAVLRIVVSRDSMKNATATSHGSSRLLASEGAGDGLATFGEGEATIGVHRTNSHDFELRANSYDTRRNHCGGSGSSGPEPFLDGARVLDGELGCCADDARAGGIIFLVSPSEQPIIETVNDGHQRGLVHVAAYSCRNPRFVAVRMEADCDAHISR